MADKPSVELPIKQPIKLPITLPESDVRNAQRPDYSPPSFSMGRWTVAFVLGLAGIGLGLVAGALGGLLLDLALGYPLGGGSGILPGGNLTARCAMVGPLFGIPFGALWGHQRLKGQGTFATAFVMTLLSLGAIYLLGTRFHASFLLEAMMPPLFVATGLELRAKNED